MQVIANSRPSTSALHRRLPVGGEVQASGGAHFRVWAPAVSKVGVVLYEHAADTDTWIRKVELASEGDGYFSGFDPEACAELCYRYELHNGAFPDPASRYQPRGPHGPSRLVDPGSFAWTDHAWKGLTKEGHVIYEMHIGTFTQEGTWRAAATQLQELADLGITILEIMPVADFAGEFGWGYDGVNLFAPTRLYGEPDDFRAFVNRAHALGLGVILDVVYNHLGGDGNYLPQFSPDYFSSFHHCDWGDALNFDAENSGPVRELFLANVAYWIDEFHLDGYRLDATQQVYDRSEEHILAAIARRAHETAPDRGIYIIGENEPQLGKIMRPQNKGGYGVDALWNDDFHHTAIVSLTGRTEAYYTDYKGSPQEFISSAKWGFLFQGQIYKWQKARRGTACLDLQPSNFITFIQNHDQVANSLWGKRIQCFASASRLRAITALMLLGPNTPMLFQGQEFGASTPFFYFADQKPELAAEIARGRANELAQFPSIAAPESTARLTDPKSKDTFHRSKLDFADRERNAETHLLHRDLLQLRRNDPFFGKVARGQFDGAVLGPSSFLLRFFGQEQNDRLLIINLDIDLDLLPAPEPLLAPPDGHVWQVAWSSEDPRYGGGGTPPIEGQDKWHLPSQSAVVLTPKQKSS